MTVDASTSENERRYWRVSPNVMNNEKTVSEWKRMSRELHAAFMGYAPEDQSGRAAGYKFAHVVRPGDVVLIARSSDKVPDLVGVGVVTGQYRTSLKGFSKPRQDGKWAGSLRTLSSFHPIAKAGKAIRVKRVLGRPALVELRPSRSEYEKAVCAWLDTLVGKQRRTRKPRSTPNPTSETGRAKRSSKRPEHRELEFEVRTAAQLRRAIKKEEQLVRAYEMFLEKKGRFLGATWYGRLQCDGYESARRNLIEAKSSVKREYIRMAVGQLLDYFHLGRDGAGKTNLGILLPSRPDRALERWLKDSLSISVIWKTTTGFQDNAGRQFT
jgi:hypothetical protein